MNCSHCSRNIGLNYLGYGVAKCGVCKTPININQCYMTYMSFENQIHLYKIHNLGLCKGCGSKLNYIFFPCEELIDVTNEFLKIGVFSK